MRRGIALLFVLFVALPAVRVRDATAQGTARAMDIDVSIRSAGMGGASAALFWGQDLNHWSNPALLGGLRGLRYEQGSTQLVPELASDVKFESRVLKAGGGGVGVVWSGTAPGPGGVHLDYGESEGTDPGGNPTGTFSAFEQVNSWGFGVSVLEAVDGFRRASAPRGWSRHGDVSFGMNFKHPTVNLAPSAEGSTTARDWGVLVRLTPIDQLEQPDALPVRVDLAYAYSVLSANDDATITFLSTPERVSRHRRDGFAGRIAFTPASFRHAAATNVWLRGLFPLVSVGGAYEKARIDAGSGTSEYRTTGSGGELEVANVFALRVGTYTDKTGDISDGTSGWSLGVPIGPWAGFRYTRASVPQSKSSGLADLDRSGWQVWVNPFEIGHLLDDD
jgi:hypothetical protein